MSNEIASGMVKAAKQVHSNHNPTQVELDATSNTSITLKYETSAALARMLSQLHFSATQFGLAASAQKHLYRLLPLPLMACQHTSFADY